MNQPIALSTVFGWTLTGKTSSPTTDTVITMCATMESVDRILFGSRGCINSTEK